MSDNFEFVLKIQISIRNCYKRATYCSTPWYLENERNEYPNVRLQTEEELTLNRFRYRRTYVPNFHRDVWVSRK